MSYIRATKEDLLGWILSRKIVVKESDDGDIAIFKVTPNPKTEPIGSTVKELTQRILKRRGSERGAYRVDIRFNNKRISIHVSHLIWMSNTGRTLPEGFEIHHINEDPTDDRWSNIIAIYSLDHPKLHVKDEEVPF